MRVQELQEIAVLAEDYGVGLFCREEYFPICGVAEVKISNGTGFEVKCACKPTSKRWWELGVDPDLHAAMPGWSSRWLAYCRAAIMSSASRSGSSSSI